MYPQFIARSLLTRVSAGALLAAAYAGPALADSAPSTDELQSEIRELRQEIQQMRAERAATPAPVAAPAQPAAAATPVGSSSAIAAGGGAAPRGVLSVGSDVTVKVGGFVEAAGIYRSRDEQADVGSTFSGIPMPNAPQSHTGEFRGSARQSRLSLLAQGDVDADMKLAGYFEADFLGAAGTANSNESNSYNPRMRVIYATLDMPEEGWHFLGGQNWSLLTMNKQGIEPRQENIPLTIDAQYAPGFNWARQWQFRAVKELTPGLNFGVSIEEPQTTFAGGTQSLASTTFTGYSGGSQLNPTQTYSSDVAPDIITKLAFDPGWGHYELFGLARFFHDQTNAGGLSQGSNNTIVGGGVGAGMLVPLIPKMLDFQGNVTVGQGIGRYGSAQLADATVTPTGIVSPIKEIQALIGIVGHPNHALDTYLYLGGEKEVKDDFELGGVGYGLGSPLYSNADCEVVGATSGCAANTAAVAQATGGGCGSSIRATWASWSSACNTHIPSGSSSPASGAVRRPTTTWYSPLSVTIRSKHTPHSTYGDRRSGLPAA